MYRFIYSPLSSKSNCALCHTTLNLHTKMFPLSLLIFHLHVVNRGTGMEIQDFALVQKEYLQ